MSDFFLDQLADTMDQEAGRTGLGEREGPTESGKIQANDCVPLRQLISAGSPAKYRMIDTPSVEQNKSARRISANRVGEWLPAGNKDAFHLPRYLHLSLSISWYLVQYSPSGFFEVDIGSTDPTLVAAGALSWTDHFGNLCISFLGSSQARASLRVPTFQECYPDPGPVWSSF